MEGQKDRYERLDILLGGDEAEADGLQVETSGRVPKKPKSMPKSMLVSKVMETNKKYKKTQR